MHKGATFILASVWVGYGFYAKLLGGVPRHELIVARFFGDAWAPWLTRGVGLMEIGMGFWVLSGRYRRLCAVVQITGIISMNTLELWKARDLLFSPYGMIFANILLLMLIVWWSRQPDVVLS
jgi:hypothetical protein